MRKVVIGLVLFIFHFPLSNAQSWVSVGGGTNNWVGTFSIYNGKLYVGGSFNSVGSIKANHIASWNGASWDSLGSGIRIYSGGGGIESFMAYDSLLFASGQFYAAGNDSARSIAEWNGTSWDSLGSGITNVFGDNVDGLGLYKGELYAGGNFIVHGTTISNIARWNGIKWDSVGSGLNNDVWTFAVYNGKLYVGGYFTKAGSSQANYIARWDGAKWDSVGTGTNNMVFALYPYNGKLYVGGSFTKAGGISANYIAVWNDTNWSVLGTGVNDGVNAIIGFKNNIYVGGQNTVAKWDGTKWSNVGASFSYSAGSVALWAMGVYDSSLYVGGWFDSSGKTPVNYIARLSDSTTGVNEIADKNEKVIVYPNPSNGIFNFEFRNWELWNKNNVEIYNVFGQLIYDTEINLIKTEINLSTQPAGIYLYRVVSEKGECITSGKLVIQ